MLPERRQDRECLARKVDGCRRKIGENCVQQGEMVDRVEKKVASHSVSD